MKKLFYYFTVLLLLFVCSCVEYGTLGIVLKASSNSIMAGETVNFDIELPSGHKFDDTGKSYCKILDSDGATVDYMNLNTLSFSFQFKLADNYQIEVGVQSQKNYGYATADISVGYEVEWLSDFSLASTGNPTSIMGTEGEVLSLDFSSIVEKNSVSTIDVRIKDTKNSTIFIKKNVLSGKCDYIHTVSNGIGTMRVDVTIYFHDGNKVVISDQFVILDPNNPVKILLEASRNDVNYPNTIFVKGRAEIAGMAGDFVELYLERNCYYGKESGIHVLAEPKGDPNDANDTTFYSKVGQDLIKHTQRYYAIRKATDEDPDDIKTEYGSVIVNDSPFVYNINDKDFTFTDPMPYYDENGNIEENGFKWTYARFDREAWKYIKRKKYFDLEKAISVEYVVYAQAIIGGEIKDIVGSMVKKGVPYLETASMAQFCMWLKECAMNRLWHMQVPRYCYEKSSSWLTAGQDHNGAVSGNVYYSAGISGGSGAIKNYSDWPGVRIYTNSDVGISSPGLSANNRRSHSASLTIITPIWPQMSFDIVDIAVRDYVLQWGLWDEGKGANFGSLKLKRGNGEEVVGYDTLLDIMPRYTNDWCSHNGYGYEAYDWEGYNEKFNGGEGSATWTHINFKYNPIDGAPAKSGIWSSKESDWRVEYAITK